MRLTIKRGNNYDFDENDQIEEVSTKLGQLEDIEEELSIDLVTLFKVLTASKLAVRHDAHFNDGKVHTHNVYKIEIIKRLKAIHITWSTLWIGDNNLHNNNTYYFKDYGPGL